MKSKPPPSFSIFLGHHRDTVVTSHCALSKQEEGDTIATLG
jgi:hypothetical protein